MLLIQVTPTGREASHLLEKFRNQYKQEVQTLGNVRTSLLLYGFSDGDMSSALPYGRQQTHGGSADKYGLTR